MEINNEPIPAVTVELPKTQLNVIDVPEEEEVAGTPPAVTR
jgi:hypothetical protein